MARVLTVNQICEEALRAIGSYSVIDVGADPYEMDIAARWLDMTIAHYSARLRWLHLVDASVTLPLNPDEISFDLLERMGAAAPPSRVMLQIQAKLRYLTPTQAQPYRDEELTICTRREWDAIEVKQQAGIPCHVYIDRAAIRPTVYVHPQPLAADTHQLYLTYQRGPRDASNQPLNGNVADIPANWNLWAVSALAAAIGSGPVRRLPDGEVQSKKAEAETLLRELEGYSNQEHADEPRRTVYNDY